MASTERDRIIVLDADWIEQAMLLSAEAGWNQIEADWRVFFTRGTVFGVVAGGRLAATAAVLPYGPDFGWISMVLVTQAHRGRGIATRLMTTCIALLRDAGRAAFLDATPAGSEVYRKLGFQPLCTLQRWQGQGRGVGDVTAAADLTLDREAFGADRSFVLDDFVARPGTISLRAPAGFAILRHGAKAIQLGPIIAGSGDAQLLVTNAINAATGPMIVDVLEDGHALVPTLAAHGFQLQRSFTRMALGRSDMPGNPARLLAAAGPEFG